MNPWLELPSKAWSGDKELTVGMNQANEPENVYLEFKDGDKKTGYVIKRKELIAYLNVLEALSK